MASGVPASPTQADITNQYLANGVVGGLLLMLLFIAIMVKGHWQIGAAIRQALPERETFVCWAAGACLFAHAVTCLSVSYYDQTVLFLYLSLATTVAVQGSAVLARAEVGPDPEHNDSGPPLVGVAAVRRPLPYRPVGASRP